MTDAQNKNYIIALDQGTTSSRAIIFDRDANVAVSYTHLTLPTIYSV